MTKEKGFTLWFTGLSGAGKTTISELVSEELHARGSKLEILDGDIVRENLSKGLGFSKEESEHLLIRADLLIQVQKAIVSRRLKQAEAAKILRVTQPRVSDLLRGRIDLFSTDSLIDMLARLGVEVRLVVKTPRTKKVA